MNSRKKRTESITSTWHWCLPEGGTLPLGLGCAWIGRRGSSGRRDDLELLHEALEQGCRFFDTAPSYGESELRLGEFLGEIDREKVVVSSKVEKDPAMWRNPGRWLRDAVTQRREGLGVETVDIVLLHDGACRTLAEPETRAEVLRTVVELRREGAFRKFGIGVRDHEIHRMALELSEMEVFLSYGDCTPVVPSALPLAEEVSSRERVFLNGTPLLSGGLLAGRDPQTVRTFADAATVEWAVEFHRYCDMRKVPVLRAALQFPLRFPAIGLTLTGPTDTEQLRGTLRELRQPLPEDFWEDWEIGFSHRSPPIE